MKKFTPDIQVESLEFGSGSPFPGQSIELAPFTIISGLHGSGKSTLLKCISQSLWSRAWRSDQPPFLDIENRDSPLGGSVRVTVRMKDEGICYSVNLERREGEDESPAKVWPDVHTTIEVPTEISMFFQDSRRKSVLNLQDGDDWLQTRRYLDALRDILGISYEEVIYHPVRVDKQLGPIFPFVRARRRNDWIDSFSMSYGELSVHRMRWFVRHPYENTVVILDEPESSIAPRGHAALADDLARLARASRVQVIAVTHSPSFITRVPLEFVRICVRRNDDPLILRPSREADLHELLGVESHLRAIIFVEDEVAGELLKLILSAHSFRGGNEVEVIDAGSWNDVLIAAASLSRSKRVRSTAVIDGDQREALKGKEVGRDALFLPGFEPPEQVLIRNAMQYPKSWPICWAVRKIPSSSTCLNSQGWTTIGGWRPWRDGQVMTGDTVYARPF
ncbi:AAA family ATPase [Streptomyces sp. NPDC003077]|uniref:AAA family ATPase n=1 Tax=Streptomyces sp. NPDC003077 TaxID=3154443 RepID=UPI0033B9B0ED